MKNLTFLWWLICLLILSLQAQNVTSQNSDTKISTQSEKIGLQELLHRREILGKQTGNISQFFSPAEIKSLQDYLSPMQSQVNTKTLTTSSTVIGRSYDPVELIQFTLDDPSNAISLSIPPVLDPNQNEAAGAVNPLDPSIAYSTDWSGNLFSIDVPTGTYTLKGNLGIMDINGLEYDLTSNILYAISANNLYIIDPVGITATLIGTLSMPQLNVSFAIDGAGQGYLLDLLGNDIYSVDLATGTIALIGNTGYVSNFSQGMFYDAATNTIYLATTNSATFKAELRSLNTTTGMTTYLGEITTPNSTPYTVVLWASVVGSFPTACAEPTSLSLGVVSESTADIIWMAGGSETDWTVKYGPTGFNPLTEGMAILVSTTPSVSISGLSPATDYDVYVMANCSGGDSSFVGPLSFTTNATPPAGNPFITTWRTTVSNQTITIPTTGGGYNYSVNWGDGNSDNSQNGDAYHTYVNPGTYTVSISGDFPRIYFDNSGDRMVIRSIEQWGDIAWTSMNAAFAGCENLVSHAMDMPNLSMVTDMSDMFTFARNFNGDANFGNWDVSNITNMSGTFGGASIFNYPIGNWNVSNVTTMDEMFFGATIFNQDLGMWNTGNVTNMREMFHTTYHFNQNLNNWDVSNVTDMSGMFAYSRQFNGNISNWDVSNVTNMHGMFAGASVFNQNIGIWNVGNVTDTASMFNGATVFKQDLSSWNVGNVTDMHKMFRTAMRFNSDIGAWNVSLVTNMEAMFFHANKFDQNLGNWDVSQVTDMANMFTNVTLSIPNYDALLNGWSTLPLQSNVKFNGGKSKYCAGEVARQYLITNFNWVITDGGLDCGAFSARMGSSNNSALVEITLYPNPMNEMLNLSNPKNVPLESVSIFDMTGRLVQMVDLTGMDNETVIDVSKLSQATYMFLIQGKDEQISKLLIKE